MLDGAGNPAVEDPANLSYALVEIREDNSRTELRGFPDPADFWEPQGLGGLPPWDGGLVALLRWEHAEPATFHFDWLFWGENGDDEFGYAISAAADVDGDSQPDYLIGAPGDMASRGKVFLISGATKQLLSSWSGAAAGDRFGAAVQIAPDMDGDGVAEIVIGAPRCDAGATDGGRIYVYSGATHSLLRTITGDALDLQLGRYVNATREDTFGPT